MHLLKMFFSKYLIEYNEQKVTLVQDFSESLFQGNSCQLLHYYAAVRSGLHRGAN